jgi:hypothetical protein
VNNHTTGQKFAHSGHPAANTFHTNLWHEDENEKKEAAKQGDQIGWIFAWVVYQKLTK